MYQGIFLPDVGEGLSVTTYYDWLGVIDNVLDRRSIDTGDGRSATAARWIGDNLRRGLDRQLEHGCAYPSFGAMLGLKDNRATYDRKTPEGAHDE